MMVDITSPEIVQVVISSDEQTVWINTEKGCVFRIGHINQLAVDDRRGTRSQDRDPVLVWLEMKKAQAEKTHGRMVELGMPHVGKMVPGMWESMIAERKEELKDD